MIMARSHGKNSEHPGMTPTPVAKVIVVNGKRAGKVQTHLRRLPGKPPRYEPPIVAAEDQAGAPPVAW